MPVLVTGISLRWHCGATLIEMAGTSPAMTTALLLQQLRHDALARQRQIANANAKCARPRIADRGSGRTGGGFADAERRIAVAFHKLDGDLRHLAEAQDRIGLPVDRPAACIVKPDLLLEHPARGLNDAAFELVDDGIWIDDQASIGGAPGA